MNNTGKVGEIFHAAGTAFTTLGDLTSDLKVSRSVTQAYIFLDFPWIKIWGGAFQRIYSWHEVFGYDAVVIGFHHAVKKWNILVNLKWGERQSIRMYCRHFIQGCAIIPLSRSILILMSHYRKIDPYWGVIGIAKVELSMLILKLVLQKQFSYYQYCYWYC